ncbi:response regulator transcription factor [Streptosporangium carneum]|uniref:Transcriptional regulatory protein CutR n=1 Tax=Streptosporangium carneum TaxID=47481 RepID=A0A9W6I890_9ACTN|nr:response regulator transcription factor [Streptosporangium carneum]GLK13567.1 transcriptional regulatory protein CutR [Streptosporangium carneum]
MRVLIAEDERVLADVVATGLRKERMAVDVVYDGDAALERATTHDYDVIVLDRDLPRIHGDEVCRRLAAERVPARIIMLTAAGDLRSKVEGLSIGADDYLAKPFDFPELVARLRALARRVSSRVPPVLSRAGVTLDPARHEVFRDGRYVALSPKEFAVLEVLMRAEGAVVSAEDLLEKAWDENISYFTNSVRVTVGTLRRKLGLPPVIETVTGVGYRL